MDNGPKLISVKMAEWAEEHGVELEFIKPGKLTQNSCIERFNRTYREEVLDFYMLRTLSEVREITDNWFTPAEYAAVNQGLENSNLAWH